MLKKIELVEKKEIENFYKAKNDEMRLKLENLAKRQQIEKIAFEKKIQAESDDYMKHRESKKEHILNKFKNKRYDLTSQQKREVIMNENEKVSRQCNYIIIK